MVQNDVKNRRSFHKRLLALLWVIVGFCVLSMAGTAVAFELIFRRTADNSFLPFDYAREDAQAYPRTEVSFASGKNMLHGYLYETPDCDGVVLVCSGIHENADSHLAEVFYLLDSGWDVMTFDFTGHGESEGAGIGSLSQASADVSAAISYLEAEAGYAEKPLCLYGFSMGGYGVAAALAEHPETAGAVCISAYDSPLGLMYADGKKYAGPLASAGYPFLWLYSMLRCGPDRSAMDCINASGVPVLVLYGDADTVVPPEESLYARAADCTADGSMFRLAEGKTHTTVLLTPAAAEALSDADKSELRTQDAELDEQLMEEILAFMAACAEAQHSRS